MKQITIGVVGEIGAGKRTFYELFHEVLRENKNYASITHFEFSKSLFETLEAYGIPPSRQNLIDLAKFLNRKRRDAVTVAMSKKLEDDMSEVRIVDGVRWPWDERMIRGWSYNLFVYVTADIKIRYERRKAAKEKIGENMTTFKEFKMYHQEKTERYIPIIGKKRDCTIENNGTREQYKSKIQKFYEEKFLPEWQKMHDPS